MHATSCRGPSGCQPRPQNIAGTKSTGKPRQGLTAQSNSYVNRPSPGNTPKARAAPLQASGQPQAAQGAKKAGNLQTSPDGGTGKSTRHRNRGSLPGKRKREVPDAFSASSSKGCSLPQFPKLHKRKEPMP